MNGFLNMEEMMKNKSPKEIALNIVNKLNLPVFPCMENTRLFTIIQNYPTIL